MQPAAPPAAADTALPVVEARAVTMRFGGLTAVDGMSIALRRGELLGLIGPNGAGKTTLFNMLAGTLTPSGGAIRIADHDIAREGAERRIARGLGRTFQIPRPFAEMTVLENVLTGGQRKLMALARVLMADPDILLLDEPAAGVNPTLLEFIIGRVQALNADGKSILLIEHNMDMVARLCSRVVVMAAGKHLTEGKPADMARNPAVIEAYLGDVA